MRNFNICVRDKHFQELHHALGCPWPEEIMGETYRNYFAVDADSSTADRMRSSCHWTNGSDKFGMVHFHVTEAGKRALLDHLRQHFSTPARYAITFHEHEGQMIVAARSRSAAKYAAYLDADLECPFGEFLAEIKSVRLQVPAYWPTPAAVAAE